MRLLLALPEEDEAEERWLALVAHTERTWDDVAMTQDEHRIHATVGDRNIAYFPVVLDEAPLEFSQLQGHEESVGLDCRFCTGCELARDARGGFSGFPGSSGPGGALGSGHFRQGLLGSPKCRSVATRRKASEQDNVRRLIATPQNGRAASASGHTTLERGHEKTPGSFGRRSDPVARLAFAGRRTQHAGWQRAFPGDCELRLGFAP